MNHVSLHHDHPHSLPMWWFWHILTLSFVQRGDQRWPCAARGDHWLNDCEGLLAACPSGTQTCEESWGFGLVCQSLSVCHVGQLDETKLSQLEASRHMMHMCHLTSRSWSITYSHDQGPGDASEHYFWGGKAGDSKKSWRSLKRGASFLGRCNWEPWEVCNSAIGIANKVEETWRNTFKEPQDDRGWQRFSLDSSAPQRSICEWFLRVVRPNCNKPHMLLSAGAHDLNPGLNKIVKVRLQPLGSTGQRTTVETCWNRQSR